MTEAQTDLDGTFDCVSNMGATGNSNERPMEAMLEALGPQTQQSGCNPGFLREDAILVVTLISDEEETGSPGNPASWRDDLLALKGGNETAVVVLALSGDAETPGLECTPTPKVAEFVAEHLLGVPIADRVRDLSDRERLALGADAAKRMSEFADGDDAIVPDFINLVSAKR